MRVDITVFPLQCTGHLRFSYRQDEGQEPNWRRALDNVMCWTTGTSERVPQPTLPDVITMAVKRSNLIPVIITLAGL